jgi:hypothetical protein
MSKTNTDAPTKVPTWAKRSLLDRSTVVEQLEAMASAAYACARATTEEAARTGYMNRCHALREAVRYLK